MTETITVDRGYDGFATSYYTSNCSTFSQLSKIIKDYIK